MDEHFILKWLHKTTIYVNKNKHNKITLHT